ncbi:hypothetical protein FB451DRAFT_1183855 [Mycena latifolia]|nr:hypothetical protein FB451DRAFT_1183855 [Mycena latifolia]
MSSICRTVFLAALLGVSSVTALSGCGDNGDSPPRNLDGALKRTATRTGTGTVLGFSANGPLDGARNPLSVIATDAGFDQAFYSMINMASISTHTSIPLCLTASALEEPNITLSLQPWERHLRDSHPHTGLPVDPDGLHHLRSRTLREPGGPPRPEHADGILVPAAGGVGAYIQLDYVPRGLPPSTGLETVGVGGQHAVDVLSNADLDGLEPVGRLAEHSPQSSAHIGIASIHTPLLGTCCHGIVDCLPASTAPVANIYTVTWEICPYPGYPQSTNLALHRAGAVSYDVSISNGVHHTANRR